MATSLKALAADADTPGVKKTDLYRVAPHLLHETEGFNLRDYNDPDVVSHIEAFANSYLNGAYVPPLVVRVDDSGNVTIVEGHCRRRGALLAVERGAEVAFLDCLPFKGNDIERVEVMLRSAEGLKLKPLAIAEGYLRLHRMGHTNSLSAKRQNKTVAHVEQMLLLANANSDVHKLVRSGAVAAYAAIEALRAHGEKAGQFLSGKVDEAQSTGKKTVTRKDVKEWLPPRKIVGGMFNSLHGVVNTFNSKKRRELAELEKLAPEQLKGMTIEVDAAAMLGLYKSWAAADEAHKSKLNETRVKQEKATQQQIEGIEGGQA